MRICLSRDARRSVVLDASMLEDSRLSFRAKGLLAYLVSHPGLDLSRIASLTTVSLEGVGAIETAIKELEDAGYLRRGEEPDSEGNLQTVAFISLVSRIPVLQPQDSGARARAGAKSRDVKLAREGKAEETAAVRVIERLNELRSAAWEWARYTPLSAKYAKNVEHINGRLSDGFSEEDLILVLEYLAEADGGKEESRKYYDCVTPFNTKNFERNLAMAREWEARGRQAARRASKHQYEQSHDPSIYDRGRRGGQL